jgi:putative transposase
MPNQVTRARQQVMRFRTHGGAREGAGRKPMHSGRAGLRHGQRPALEARFPVHVTKRVRRDVTRLRRFELCKVLRGAFVHGCIRGAFRICQFSIQGNHIHLICEASDNVQLARGIQGWSVRVARGLNGHLGRTGSVFDDRYHLEILTTPTQTRHALCYVLQNARRHGEQIDPRFGGMDPFSSAWWFDGWRDASWKIGIPPPEVRTVAAAETWLLRVGWKRSTYGLLSITELPPAGRR